MFHYIEFIKQNRKHLSMTWENLHLLTNLLYCSWIHCSQMGIFRLEISVSLCLLLTAIKYLSIFHLKIVPAANQEKSYGIIIKNKTNTTKYPLTPHSTFNWTAACRTTIRAPQNLIYGGIYKQNATGHFWGNFIVLSRRN